MRAPNAGLTRTLPPRILLPARALQEVTPPRRPLPPRAPPVITWLAIALKGLGLNHMLKFALVALIGVPVCYGVAWLIRRIPGVAGVM